MTYVVVVLVFLFFEAVLFGLVFSVLGLLFLKGDTTTKDGVGFVDFAKGIVERLVLSVALANNIPQILIFFGAMKVATRLKTDTDSAKFNNFFLVGNLTSVFVAIQYSKHLGPDSQWIQQMANWVCRKLSDIDFQLIVWACH